MVETKSHIKCLYSPSNHAPFVPKYPFKSMLFARLHRNEENTCEVCTGGWRRPLMGEQFLSLRKQEDIFSLQHSEFQYALDCWKAHNFVFKIILLEFIRCYTAVNTRENGSIIWVFMDLDDQEFVEQNSCYSLPVLFSVVSVF